MKSFKSAFAAPSGFVVASNGGKPARRSEARTNDMQASTASMAKPRNRDVRDRAA